MKSKFKILSIILSLLLISTILASCSKTEPEQTTSVDSSEDSSYTEVSDTSSDEMFTSRDREYGYDEASASKIEISSKGISCDDNAVTVVGSTVTL